MFKLVVCIVILFAACSARERFTCLKTDENENSKAPGVREMTFVRDQLKFLAEEVAALKKYGIENRQLIAQASKGLYFAPDVYIYQFTSSRQSWQESRQFCKNWGGDLAVHGVKTLENRKKLIINLSINNDFWIGVNDIATEGNWTWVNDEPASSSEIIWDEGQGQPDGGIENCVAVVAYPAATYRIGLTHDGQCHWRRFGLCEKKLLKILNNNELQ